MKEKNIYFIPKDEMVSNVIEPPLPAINFLPEWYKDIDSYLQDPLYKRPPTKRSNSTVKTCVPFFDAMNSGYIVTLPCDIVFVDAKKYEHKVYWDADFTPIGSHALEQIGNMPIPKEYNSVWKWMFHYIIKTPPGYSCLFSHPKFRYDLPFLTIDGIVDTDSHSIPINFPFFINDNFEGILKKGTPIVQIFPFKRDNWKKIKKLFDKKYSFEYQKHLTVMSKFYKKNNWKRKVYK